MFSQITCEFSQRSKYPVSADSLHAAVIRQENDDMLAERSPDCGIGRPEEDDAPCSAERGAMAHTGIISQVDPRSRKLFAQHIERLRTYNPYPSGYCISKAPFDFGRPQDKRDFTTP